MQEPLFQTLADDPRDNDALANELTTLEQAISEEASDRATAISVLQTALASKADLVGGKHTAAQSRGSSLDFNATNGNLTLTGADNGTSIANLPTELLLQSVSYNSTTKVVRFTTNGGATVDIPLTDLVDLPEVQVATQNPVSAPTSGQRLYFRSDTGSYWVANGPNWIGPRTPIAIGFGAVDAFRGDLGLVAWQHSQSAHAPADAQKNSDITKAEIEAKLTGNISSILNWTQGPQTFREINVSERLFTRRMELGAVLIDGSGAVPNATTLLIDIASDVTEYACNQFMNENDCVNGNENCTWNEGITCSDYTDQSSCLEQNGACEWVPMQCSDIYETPGTCNDDPSCSWVEDPLGNCGQLQTEEDCNNGQCSWDYENNECVGNYTPFESYCSGELNGECLGSSEPTCSGGWTTGGQGFIELSGLENQRLIIARNVGTDAVTLLDDQMGQFQILQPGTSMMIQRVEGQLRVIYD